MRAIMMSIKPKWCELIANGGKTIEIRKTAPAEVPFKVYIYCIKSCEPLYLAKYNEYDEYFSLEHWGDTDIVVNGKVIGEFICNEVELFDTVFYPNKKQIARIASACVDSEQLCVYKLGRRFIGALYISNLKIYNKPKELSEFGIKRPPQSWFYVGGTKRMIKLKKPWAI